MNVELINCTPSALETLLFTKQTRLTMEPGLLDKIRDWPEERKLAELDYMRGTIQSSWEFIDYIFSISNVSRAFTHQFVRTRTASFAQQSQRTVDMEGFDYITPKAIEEMGGEVLEAYADSMADINDDYQYLRELGILPQDARAVLPTNVSTNIIAKFNLRTLADTAKTRLCTRTQGEYQSVFRAMRSEVIAVHPWAEDFIQVACAVTGVCQFPNYHECPIKPPTFNPDTGLRWDEAKVLGVPLRPATRGEIRKKWEDTNFEAVPQQGKKT